MSVTTNLTGHITENLSPRSFLICGGRPLEYLWGTRFLDPPSDPLLFLVCERNLTCGDLTSVLLKKDLFV